MTNNQFDSEQESDRVSDEELKRVVGGGSLGENQAAANKVLVDGAALKELSVEKLGESLKMLGEP